MRDYRPNHPAFDDRTSYDYQKEWSDNQSETRPSRPTKAQSKHKYPRRILQVTQPADGNTDIMLTAQLKDDSSVVVFVTYTDHKQTHRVHRALQRQHKDDESWHFASNARVYFDQADILDALDTVQSIIRSARCDTSQL